MRRVAILAVAIVALTAHAADNPDAAAVQDFQKRVSAYVRLHKDLESKLPSLKATASPEKISHHQHALAEAIRAARRNAAAGEIFTPPIAAEFRRLIALAMQADGSRIDASLRHAEPVRAAVRVNGSWPAGIPLQSTPPTILSNLPHLPEQIEYRIDGRNLILLDVGANLVVDLVFNALP